MLSVFPHSFEVVRDITEAGLDESIEFNQFTVKEGKWLPIVIGKNLTDALDILETRMSDYYKKEFYLNSRYEPDLGAPCIQVTREDYRTSVDSAYSRLYSMKNIQDELSNKESVLLEPKWVERGMDLRVPKPE